MPCVFYYVSAPADRRSIAATAAVLTAAITTAAENQNNCDNDPAAIPAKSTLITHSETS